jgi:hypothetical protein
MRLSEIDPNTIGPGDKVSIDFGTPPNDTEKVIEYLKQNCSDIIEDMRATKKLLYRGLKRGELGPIFVGQSRQDRKPKDTGSKVSAFFDQALASHGFKALRSNSIFVTSEYHHALSYGNAVYAIFPINGFNFTYTNSTDLVIKIPDLIDYPKNLLENAWRWFLDHEAKAETDPKFPEALWKELGSRLDYAERLKSTMKRSESDRSSYFKSLYYICQDLNKLSFILKDDAFIQQFRNFDVTDSSNWSEDAVIRNLNPKNTDIQKAMKAKMGREIFINGKYVALSELYYIRAAVQELVGRL